MKTDRELLELAAKAYGIQLNGAAMAPMYMGTDGQWVFWNPLEDDGDALRLAVKLNIAVFPKCVDEYSRAHAQAIVCDESGMEKGSARQELDGDHYSDTRRAIVLAAAAIGEAM